MRHYENDPRAFRTRYFSTCAKCSKKLPQDSLAYYFPATRKLLCQSCGGAVYNAFLSSATNEEYYSRQYNYR
ncbi:MAG: hypothetical protein Q8J88_02110 [Bacteroidales bacterium]|nr:hypothetical protein [Bacteroidales bacterium]